MRLATLRLADRTVAVQVDDETAVETGYDDVGELLRAGHVEAAASPMAPDTTSPTPTSHPWSRPGQDRLCRLELPHSHLEMGRELPEYPTLFAKYPEALIGPGTKSNSRPSPRRSTGRASSL